MSHAAKVRIIVGASAVSLVVLGSFWLNDTKNNLVGMDTNSIIPTGIVLSANKHVTIESYEERGDKRYIYFKVQNNTGDILNFSQTDKITFKIDRQSLVPVSVTERQGSPFVSKVLSNTTVYGTLVFDKFEDTEGVLIFDELYFENQPSNVFQESIEVDITELKPVEELRS